jgi:hypothetical protein
LVQKEVHVSTITQGPATRAPTRAWTALLTATEMWASLAIAIIWIAVLFAAVYGPDFVSRSAGGDSTIVPSGIGVALFASIATWAIAKHAFGRRARDTD